MYHILLENKRNSDFAISKKDIVQNAKLPFSLHTLAGILFSHKLRVFRALATVSHIPGKFRVSI